MPERRKKGGGIAETTGLFAQRHAVSLDSTHCQRRESGGSARSPAPADDVTSSIKYENGPLEKQEDEERISVAKDASREQEWQTELAKAADMSARTHTQDVHRTYAAGRERTSRRKREGISIF